MSLRASAMFPEKRRPSKERESFFSMPARDFFQIGQVCPAIRRVEKVKRQVEVAQLDDGVRIAGIEFHGAAEVLARLRQLA